MRRFRKETNSSERKSFPWKNTLLFVALLILLNLLYPRLPFQKLTLKTGDIAPKDVIAPFTFPILKGEDELRREREEAAEGILPVVLLETERTQEVSAKIEELSKGLKKLRKSREPLARRLEVINSYGLGLAKETLMLLLSSKGKRVIEEARRTVEKILKAGLIQDKGAIPLGRERRVSLRTEEGEYTRDLKDIFDQKESGDFLKERGLKLFPKDEDSFKAFVGLSPSVLRPNLLFDLEETERRREIARREVKETKGIVLKGEMIVRAHDPVTEERADKLRSLELALGPSPPSRLLPIFGRTVIFALILAFFAVYLSIFQPSLSTNLHHLLLLSLLAIVMIEVSSLTISLKGLYYYLIPMAFVSTVVSLLLGSEIAFFLTVTLSLLISMYSGMRLAGPLVALFGGTAAIISVRGLRSRGQFYRSMLWVSGVNIAAIASIEAFRTSSLPVLFRGCSFGVLNGFGSIFLAIGFLPVLERLFGVTTNITLLELSDLNRPILRRLAFDASGTYHHSLVVGSLSEAAAQAIGANPLLARVASYYHDIGKLKKPDYYIENQSGVKNPHERLTPKMSSLIVASHVKDGVERAKEEKLPKEIVDIIPQHHGTALMLPFYERAKALNPEDKVDDHDFRYPGPKPQTKEAAIVMLADSVEATARSLEEPTASRLKGVVKSVIERRLADGELDESGLTLKDLHKIRESFLPILIGVFHPRLDYPKEEGDEDLYRKPGRKGKAKKEPAKRSGKTNAQGGRG